MCGKPNVYQFQQALPYMLLTFVVAIIVAYASLKLYDEPVRAWLRKTLSDLTR